MYLSKKSGAFTSRDCFISMKQLIIIIITLTTFTGLNWNPLCLSQVGLQVFLCN